MPNEPTDIFEEDRGDLFFVWEIVLRTSRNKLRICAETVRCASRFCMTINAVRPVKGISQSNGIFDTRYFSTIRNENRFYARIRRGE